jgi:hypothetical protein
MHSRFLASALAVVLSFPPAVLAQQQPAPQDPPRTEQPPSQKPQPPEQQDAAARKRLEADIAKELGQGGATATPAAPRGQPAAAAAAPQGSTGGNPMARLLLLPDISAIGSFAGALDSYDVERLSPREGPFGPKDKPTPLFQELELGLQSVIDPYARADLFISFSPGEGAAVEEAYLTSLNLPAGFQLRAGQLFSPFGRLNPQHPHVWDFVDAPLARGRLLADEVLSGPGVDVAWLAPLPWFAELHVAGQGTSPAPSDEDPGERLTGIVRLLQYFSIGDATTVGVGFSAARRSEATGAFRDVGAADLYLRWRPLRSRSYVTLQGEVFARKFRGDGLSDALKAAMPVLAANVERGTDTGGYAQLFVRQGAYFGYGVRYDEAPVAAAAVEEAEAAPGTERRFGALATWFPSEFQRLRLQVSYDRRPGGQDGVEALLSLEFGIGSHGAHPF